MPNKMLIDASHPEETRVVVTRGNRIEEFDFESQDKKQLKGNIYLARVTRVEPSLQAAFVEYGGNRHGFLAFSEIHPDYYQIPVADRQALLRAEAEAAREEEEDEDEERGEKGRGRRRRGRGRSRSDDQAADQKAEGGDEASAEDSDDDGNGNDDGAERSSAVAERIDGETVSAEPETSEADSDEQSDPSEAANSQGGRSNRPRREDNGDHGDHDHRDEVEVVGAGDALEEARSRRKPVRRSYKIQEVVKRRQILLVQVVKEERGNKGAALTTYLSLAGRYSVLMPNTARGGGISRKITNAQDRKRLKDVVKDLDVPQGMGVILRTAGESRTKAEIKRDYEYLMRLWENVRNLTLESTAPALVYEEGSLIKRSVRDLYNKDIEEILVAGEDGYREAKDFMRMLMPSHAKMVQPYRDLVPIFARNGIEGQLDKMLHPQVTLKSGGYIIINQTEALVSIDVNSGRSTREHSIEDTALQTNLEAAEEVARQLRLRDMAGLIVIDFIDMEENRNNRAVEKKMKDCLKNDRARIQVGRISHFGLLEMSRQRIRASVLESTMQPCPHCGGTGHIRSDSSVALHVVRAIEEFLLKDSRNHITVRTPVATALYVLNHKRRNLIDLELRFGLTITIEGDDSVGSQHYVITRGAIAERPADMPLPQIAPAYPVEDDDIEDEAVAEPETEEEEEAEPAGERGEKPRGDDDENRDRKRRRRRRRRGRDRDDARTGDATSTATDGVSADGTAGADETDEAGDEPDASAADATAESDGERRKRRRGKRGGRRNRREDGDAGTDAAESAEGSGEDRVSDLVASVEAEARQDDDEPATATEQDDAPQAEPVAEAASEASAGTEPSAGTEDVPAPKRPARRRKAETAEGEVKPPRARRSSEAAAAAAETANPDVVSHAPAKVDDDAPSAEADDAAATDQGDPSPEPVAATPAETVLATEPKVSSSVAAPDDADKPKKAGWWQRKSFF